MKILRVLYRKIPWMLIVIIIAILLRTVFLDKNPIELFGDELDAGYQAYSLLKTGRDYRGHLLPFYAQSFSEWRAPLLMYAMAPFIKIFGLNEWGVRLTSAFWGVVAIISFNALLKRFKVAQGIRLASTLFLAISPWHIQYSRAGFELTLATSLIIIGSVFLLDSITKKRKFLAVVGAIITGLSFYTYNTTNLFAPLVILGLIVIRLKTTKKAFAKKTILAVYFATILVISLPLLKDIFGGHAAERFSRFSVIGHQSITDQITYYRNNDSSHTLLKRILLNRPVFWVKKIAANYANSFSSDVLFGHGDVTFRHSLHYLGALFWIQLPLIIFSLVYMIADKFKEDINKFMVYWMIIAPIPASLTIDGGNHMSRLFYLVYPLAYFSGLSVVKIYNSAITKRKIADISKLSLILISVFLIFEFSNYQYYYWVHYPKESWRWWHYGYKEAMQTIAQKQNTYNQIIIESTYEPALIRYLFWTKVNPKNIFSLQDKFKPEAVDGLDGFCLSEKDVCFVNFGEPFPTAKLKPSTLYLISQEINVPGDWDWSKNPPEEIKVLKTIRTPTNQPLFYLIAKR